MQSKLTTKWRQVEVQNGSCKRIFSLVFPCRNWNKYFPLSFVKIEL